MNITNLRKLKRYVLAEPRRYYQGYWLLDKKSDVVEDQKPPCGTAGCLAGLAALMEGYVLHHTNGDAQGEYQRVSKPRGKKTFNVESLAMEILGLTQHQADQLFEASGMGWPNETGMMLRAAQNPKKAAQAAAAAIDILIAREQAKRSKK